MKIGINAGSGQRPFTSTPEVAWYNWDCQTVELDGKTYEPDQLCDLKEVWPTCDESADYIVLHHVIEHEGCGEAQHYQREAYRVLKPRGSLLVFVPDMRALAQAWLVGKMGTQLYMTNVYGAFHGDDHDRHRWGFDRASLASWFGPVSVSTWSEVKDFNWRVIEGASLAKDWWILGMEAVK